MQVGTKIELRTRRPWGDADGAEHWDSAVYRGTVTKVEGGWAEWKLDEIVSIDQTRPGSRPCELVGETGGFLVSAAESLGIKVIE